MIQSQPGYFQELDIELPFTADDLFTDHDYEIISNANRTDAGIKTANLYWTSAERELGNAAWIHSKAIKRRLQEYMFDTFAIPFLPKSIPRGLTGRSVFPATLICFTADNLFHKEGYTDDMLTNSDRQNAHYGRINYSLNFKMLGPTENAGTFFGEPSDTVSQWDKIGADNGEAYHRTHNSYGTDPYYTHMINDNPAYEYNHRRSGFRHHSDVNQHDYITTVAKKEGFEKPYIINLSKFHRVDMTPIPQPRVAMRIHGNWRKYSFEYIQQLHNEGKLLK